METRCTPRAHTFLTCLIWGMWNSLARCENKTPICSRSLPCSIQDLSWKFLENSFTLFFSEYCQQRNRRTNQYIWKHHLRRLAEVKVAFVQHLTKHLFNGIHWFTSCFASLIIGLEGSFDNTDLVPTWIRNNIHRKVWDEMTYPFPNFNGFKMYN